jgi:hypothetical protein
MHSTSMHAYTWPRRGLRSYLTYSNLPCVQKLCTQIPHLEALKIIFNTCTHSIRYAYKKCTRRRVMQRCSNLNSAGHQQEGRRVGSRSRVAVTQHRRICWCECVDFWKELAGHWRVMFAAIPPHNFVNLVLFVACCLMLRTSLQQKYALASVVQVSLVLFFLRELVRDKIVFLYASLLWRNSTW